MNSTQNPKIRAILVDDESLARASVISLLADDPEVEVVQECETGLDAIAAVRSLRPELVFLDVQMPDLDGFDVLEQLGPVTPKAIILITAHEQYALKAFEAQAIDYLLKPFSNLRFQRALLRAKALISDRDESLVVLSSKAWAALCSCSQTKLIGSRLLTTMLVCTSLESNICFGEASTTWTTN